METPQINNNQEINDEDLSAWQSMRNSLRDEYILILKWVKPDPDKNKLLEYVKLIYKLPILLLVTLLSPVAFLILVIVFFATL